MGEAVYYLIAEFETEEEAEMAERRARVVLGDLAEFEGDWQQIRDDHERPVKERHEELLKKHPLVEKFIELPDIDDNDPMVDYLAGKCEINTGYEMRRNDIAIYLHYGLVWHLASCDNIKDFFLRLGAEEVAWISDEHTDPFELVVEVLKGLHGPQSAEKFPEETLRREIDPILVAKKLASD